LVIETIFLGILLGFIYYEIVGLTPGGIIVPGYIALYLHQPFVLLSTLVVIFLTFFIVKGLSHLVILYGRRAFLAAVMVGFLLKWGVESYLFQMNSMRLDLEIIGYIIPGLIANEMRKQGTFETLLSLSLVSSLVYYIMKVQSYFFK